MANLDSNGYGALRNRGWFARIIILSVGLKNRKCEKVTAEFSKKP